MAKSAPVAPAKKIPSRLIGLGVVLVLGWWLMSTYNGFISAEGNVNKYWAQVETEYQRRADLIPGLISTVQGAADFEQSTLVEVTEARTKWLETNDDPNASLGDQVAATQNFDSALSRLLVSVESYPTLTATEGFQTFQSQLEGTENRVAVARMDFNNAAGDYNIQLRRFPANIVAGIFGFEASPLFEADEGSEDAPDVEFDFGKDEAKDETEAVAQ